MNVNERLEPLGNEKATRGNCLLYKANQVPKLRSAKHNLMKLTFQIFITMVTFLSLTQAKALDYYGGTIKEDSISTTTEHVNPPNTDRNWTSEEIEMVNLDNCANCKGSLFSFDGTYLSFIRVYNEKNKIVELNAAISEGENVYSFKRAGTYYMEFNYKDGHQRVKKIVVEN